ncbi:thiol methyltransferase 2 [Hirschfeldia incana]|nr:thiol methyltransferase 2 [Hirschfeldia incana]
MMWWQWLVLIVMSLDWIYLKLWLSNHQRDFLVCLMQSTSLSCVKTSSLGSQLKNLILFSTIPSVRPLWAQRIEKLLKPSGELITLMFPLDERSGGPPYKVSVSDYEKVLIPLGFEAISIVDNELAIRPRKGVEKIGRWKKKSPTFHSTL